MLVTLRCINAKAMREHPGQRRENYRRYRARLLNASAPGVSERDWRRLVNRFGGRCAYCGTCAPMTQDHIVPLSRGGQHAIGNLLPACMPCNSAKRASLLIYWRLGRSMPRVKRGLAA